MKSFASRSALAATLAFAAAGGVAAKDRPIVATPTTGPAADYPMVIGEPFVIEGTTYKPADTLNYDTVGYAAIDPSGGEGITGSHKTLPLPSYVEVTSLDSGRTILVRLQRRGPMTNSRLVGLSPGAFAQLGLGGGGAVRVRRVNPPEPERAALRNGATAPLRMDTPKPLLAVLMRRLDQQNGGAITLSSPKPTATATTPATMPVSRRPLPRIRPEPQPALAVVPTAAHPPSSPPPAAHPPATVSALVVQVAALSNKPRADALATKLGGRVTQAGRMWRIRLGPFSTQAEAAAALVKARGAGYSDARIQRAD